MSFENPFRKNKPASIPEGEAKVFSATDIAATAEHFERSQEDGLTDAQRERINEIEASFEGEGEAAVYEKRVEAARAEIERIQSMPAGSQEKTSAAYELSTRLSRPDAPADSIRYVPPTELWGAPGDQVWEAMSTNPRFTNVLEKAKSLEERSKATLEEGKGLYEKALQEKSAA